MALTLNLGVHEIAYAAQFAEHVTMSGKARKRPKVFSAAQKAYGAGKTTGQVAEFLEDRYGIMRAFYDHRGGRIAVLGLETATRNAILNMMMGQPGAIDVTAETMQNLATEFKKSLSERRYDQWINAGRVPTKAALAGVSHRFKFPYKKRPERPSFIDTGMYQSSFVAWMIGTP
jgi:hypothetical protein